MVIHTHSQQTIPLLLELPRFPICYFGRPDSPIIEQLKLFAEFLPTLVEPSCALPSLMLSFLDLALFGCPPSSEGVAFATTLVASMEAPPLLRCSERLPSSALRDVKIPPGPRLLILDHIQRDPELKKVK
ncbi:hypothetical protein KSP39_PZI003936 [Platanthera zijinensis]|uniref:Uncharacterized protein n=1 Tax=Platanthera zijinensis TaxID=2320716 RepID=A0AAP0BW05_9ASPA